MYPRHLLAGPATPVFALTVTACKQSALDSAQGGESSREGLPVAVTIVVEDMSVRLFSQCIIFLSFLQISELLDFCSFKH